MSKAAVNTLKTIDDANVTALTDKTFNTTKDKHDLMVTLFYLPCKYEMSFDYDI